MKFIWRDDSGKGRSLENLMGRGAKFYEEDGVHKGHVGRE